MNPTTHKIRAEALLVESEELEKRGDLLRAQLMVARAQVHAILARL